jgi:SAM-dependent methyltransferase
VAASRDRQTVTGGPYRRDLALVHHLGFGFHAAGCAPGVLRLLEPVRGGLVVELGCGSGLLTGPLRDAGHRVVATDGSPAMVALAREQLPGADVRRLVLPEDPVPPADAVVGVGHVLSYLPDVDAVHRALRAVAAALRPGGRLALDVCDLRYGQVRAAAPPHVRVEADWAIATRFSLPAPDRFVRDVTTFVRAGGLWRRDDERHTNVLLDTAALPDLLDRCGVDAEVRPAFGAEELPEGLVALVGTRR